MKITKATVKRINDHCSALKETYIPVISTIGEILCQSGVIVGNGKRYVINDGDEYVTPLIHSDGNREFVSGTVRSEYEKRLLRGLYTRYPNWLSCTFTLGLNGVDIYEVNKLVKAIIEN